MENKKPIEIIQNFGRKILLKNIQKEIKSSPLFIVETKSFAQLRRVQRDPKVKMLMNKLKSLIRLSDNDIRVIEMGIMIAWHPNNIFGEKSKWHPLDDNMHQHSNFLLINLIEQNNPKLLKSFLHQYVNIFKKWKEGDKQRTIEGIIISYHHRAEHLEKIKNDDTIENEQKLLMIKTINNQMESLTKSLLMIDKDFPINMLKESHNELFETYKKGWENTFNNIRNVVVDSYRKHLVESLNKGDYSIIRNEINAISNRLLELSPKKILKSLQSKMNLQIIDNIFMDELPLESTELLKYLLLLIDTTIIFDSEDNDQKNQEWKNLMINKMNDLKENLPEILLSINKNIDSIINKLKELVKKQ